jgi:D-glycero-D-manno-heptose 1,7-bisphosphate phosphatase
MNTPSPLPLRRALFLDRDGVINVDSGYTHRIEDFVFVPGIFELAARGHALGMALVVVTNQAGIGRGLYTEDDFQHLTLWMRERFAERGSPLAAVYHCPFHPEAGVGAYRRESEFRKPNPGMLLQARSELGLDLARSAIVGDKPSDIEAGRRAGVGLRILLDIEDAAAEGFVLLPGERRVSRLQDAEAWLGAAAPAELMP